MSRMRQFNMAIASVGSKTTGHGGLDRRNLTLALVLSAFVPPILLYASWVSRSTRQRHWLLTVFVGWYAASLPISFDASGMGSDGVRHLLAVYVHYSDMTVARFMSDLWNILLFRGSESSNDVFRHVVAFFVGRIIGVPELFFPIVGLFYGYFFVGSMLIILRDLGQRKLPWVIIFLGLCFFLSRNIESLQAVRNPTAGWVLIYGILRYQETRKLRYVGLMACTPLIHFSFLLIALPAFIYLAIGKRPLVYAVLFAVSLPFSFVNPGDAIDLISQVEIGEQKVLDRSERGREVADTRTTILEQEMTDGTRLWRAYMMAGYQKIALNIFIFGMILSSAYFVMDRFGQAVFSNGLLMLTASNSLWFLGGATGRLWGVGFLLVMAGFLIWRLKPTFAINRSVSRNVYVASCFLSAAMFVPYFLFHVSRLLDYLNIFLFALPWLALYYPSANLTLKTVLRAFLPI